jgi:DNA adenine methylase
MNIVIFCRIGNKKKIKDKILNLIPNDFNLYVEPFVGSGAIFLNVDLENKKSVINDLDKNIVQGHSAIKSGVTLDPKTFIFKDTQNNIYNKSVSSTNDKFLKSVITACGTFGAKGVGKLYLNISNASIRNKIKNAIKQKDHYNNTRIFNTDYKKIIKKFDSSKSFFYLDPPYESSKALYKDETFDFDELSNILKNIKGRFLLSLNDSPNIRNIFKNFKIISILVKGSNSENIGKDRKELLILNY